MAERDLKSLTPVRFILEYRTANPRQEMEDGQRTEKVDIIPEAIRLETPAVKPIMTMREINRSKTPDMTDEVAHRAYGRLSKGNRFIAVTLDTSVETVVRLALTPAQQTFFTNYTEASFQIHRRIAARDQAKQADAPVGVTGERQR